MVVADKKFYYQILVVMPRKYDKLLFWVRNTKIEYSTKEELINGFPNEIVESVKILTRVRPIDYKDYIDNISNNSSFIICKFHNNTT